MHNKLKNKMSSFFFQNFSKTSYHLVSKVSGKEEVYYRDNKLVVLIEDAEVGKRLYPVLKSLIDWDVRILTSHIEFQVEGYVADKSDTVQMFFADLHLNFSYSWKKTSVLNQLQALVSFAYAMEEKGYFLDSHIFNNETCRNISDFLSFFSPNASEVETSNACLIKYIHYALSGGGDLEEFYTPIVKENKLTALGDFPYQMPIITMCYNYYLSGDIPKDIGLVLQEEREKDYHLPKNRLLVSNPDFSEQYSITDENEEYIVYGETIKIFKKEISPELKELLQDDERQFLRKYSYDFHYYHDNSLVREVLLGAILDFNKNIIGYQYRLDTLENEQPILERQFDSQSDIIQFISCLDNILFRTLRGNETLSETDNECFNIETDVICSKDTTHPREMFRILTIQDLKKLKGTKTSTIREQITMIFFKLLYAYLEEKYGKLSTRRRILSKKEVRYLSPVLANSFAKYAVGRPIDLPKATEVLYHFLSYDLKTDYDKVSYDRRLLYESDTKASALFQYEVESKYGIKFQKDKTVTLLDGRKMVMFSHEKTISNFFTRVHEIKDDIRVKFEEIESDYMKLTDISEVIYSSNLDSEDLYKVAGYVSTPIHGIPLTLDLLLGFNNKQILQVAGKLIAHFGEYSLNNILIDINEEQDNFTFYVDILDPSFQIKKNNISGGESYPQSTIVEHFFEYLENQGYNSNAFVDINLEKDFYKQRRLKYHLVDYANSLHAYCDEHKIYYASYANSQMCPVCLKTKCLIENDFNHRYEKLFEDEYAVHYQYDSSYNLKIYKDNIANIEKLQENVDAIILMKLRGTKIELNQDCFIPEKKAMSEEGQFIGYLYSSVDFNDIGCKSLKDVERFSNLPKIKSLIRLIKQVEELTINGYIFDRNPFGDVFLCINHKKQVQIVNIDFLSKQKRVLEFEEREKKTEESLKWLYQYVKAVIYSDSNIELASNIRSKKILKSLEDLAQSLTMHCTIHNFYYPSEKIFCPKCTDISQMKKFEIEQVKSSEISSWEHLKQGGESTIYLRKDGSVAKVFNEKVDYSFKVQILGAIFRKKKILDQINKEANEFQFVIPQKLLIDSKTHQVLGYIMKEKVKGVPILTLKDTEKVHSKLGYSRKDVFEILITVGNGIQTLHDKANIYIGDLNGGNILINAEKNVYFLDFDGMGVDNIAPRFSTEGYIDPVSQKTNNITQKDDWYSFAIQAFYYLTYTHPFNGVYKGRRLEIPEKMELKLSLLGDHGITPPSIAQPWDWMNADLRNAFLNIFEGESRVNIVTELKKQYHELYGGIKYQAEDEIIPINNKFVAKRNYLFDTGGKNVVRVINHFTTICSENEEYYVFMLLGGTIHKLHVPNCMQIKDIFWLNYYAIVVYQDKIVAFDYETEQKAFQENYNKDSDIIVVNDNTLYLSQKDDGENMIYEIDFNKKAKVKKSKISFLPEQKTVGLLVKFNSKFMLIKRDSNGKDTIYCNSEKLCNMESGSQNSKYRILYDKTTKMWLVISSNKTVITVKSSNSEYKRHYLSIEMDNINVQNATIDNGILYLPGEGVLYIINVRKEMTIKRLECDKLITPDSHLCNFNPNGFSIITNYSLYDISKKE